MATSTLRTYQWSVNPVLSSHAVVPASCRVPLVTLVNAPSDAERRLGLTAPPIPDSTELRRARRARQERRALTRGELARLLSVGRPQDRALLVILYDLALRAGEVSLLSWEDIEGDRILVRRLKDGRDGWLALSGVTRRALAILSESKKGPILPCYRQQKVRDWYRYLARRAKLPPDKHYSHILRRSRATHMLDDGATVTEIQWTLGHKSPKTTLIYLGITEETQQKARKLALSGMDKLLSTHDKSRA